MCRLNYCLPNEVRRTVIISVQRRTRKTYSKMLTSYYYRRDEIYFTKRYNAEQRRHTVRVSFRSDFSSIEPNLSIIRLTPLTEPVNSHQRIN